MNKYSYGLKFGTILAFMAVFTTNLVLYFMGFGAFELAPLLVVATFAALFGAIMGLARAEDSLV